MTVHFDAIVVGAGAAGLMAGAQAARRDLKTVVLEKNKQAGVKVLMSGGTRCNLTHATDSVGIAAAFAGRQGDFLRSSLAALTPEATVEWFAAAGVPTKIEESGKVFPVTDRAIDVRDALLRDARQAGCQVLTATAVDDVRRHAGQFRVTTVNESFQAPRLILCCGGCSYPRCGTTGDGYRWARKLGHTIVPPIPALTPLTTNLQWVHRLSGITLPDVRLSLVIDTLADTDRGTRSPPLLAEQRSSLLFTHFGLSGPAPMNVSRAVHRNAGPQPLAVVCNFLPSKSPASFLEQLKTEVRVEGRRQVRSLLGQYVPRRLTDALLERWAIPSQRRAAELSKVDLRAIATGISATAIGVSGTLGFKKAEVTAGGVSLDEVDSRNLQSKIVPGLHFAGEVLDIDGPIGGYNFQAAFSTGWLAGQGL